MPAKLDIRQFRMSPAWRRYFASARGRAWWNFETFERWYCANYSSEGEERKRIALAKIHWSQFCRAAAVGMLSVRIDASELNGGVFYSQEYLRAALCSSSDSGGSSFRENIWLRLGWLNRKRFEKRLAAYQVVDALQKDDGVVRSMVNAQEIGRVMAFSFEEEIKKAFFRSSFASTLVKVGGP